METKHTKGEWTYEDRENPAHSIVISTPKFPLGIATVYGGRDGLANAKLISAAPELLEACIKALIHIDVLNIEKGLKYDLEKAIKKATE
jgi:hypothetical protein